MDSTISRLNKALYAPAARSGSTGAKGAFPATVDVDGGESINLECRESFYLWDRDS